MAPHPVIEGREPLTRDQILEHALEIIDAEGAEALSMRRLASGFGVEAMALYYHFPNKQAILDGVVNTVVAQAAGGQPLVESPDWRVTMRSGILLVRSALLAHPNVAPLVLSRSTHSPAAMVWVEGPLRILYDAGLRGTDLVSAYHQIVAYVFGWHLVAMSEHGGVWAAGSSAKMVGAPNADAASRASASEPSEASGQAEPREPSAELFLSTTLGDSLGDWSEGFEDGLDAVLDSIDRVVRSARAAAEQEA